VGRAAGDVQIHRDDGVGAVVLLGVADVGTAGDGAGADRDDDAGLGDGLVGLLQGDAHVLGDRAGDEQAVGVTRRGDHLDAEAGEVEDHRPQHVDVRLAAVAPTGAHLAQLERAAVEPPQLLAEGEGA